MKKNDVSFSNEDKTKKFNYRVALLAVHEGKILLQKAKKDDYFSLIGGRVELYEDSKNAIIREVKEEVGITLKGSDLKLVNVVENFFNYNNVDFHELLFIYKSSNEELWQKDNIVTLDKEDVISSWFDINEIKNMDVRPSFIKDCYDNDTLTSLVIRPE